MSPKQFAKKTNYSISSIKQFCREGKIKSKKVKIPGGFVYEISPSESKKLSKDNRGWHSVSPVP